jgi:hypothetical protein
MDDLTRAHYELTFKVCFFIDKKGEAFQDFFSSVMEKRYPADFIRVRPWGKLGDYKNDGYLKSRRTLFQTYAPNEMIAHVCVAKIDEDFTEALPYWKEHFSTWVFVHNSRDGLGPTVTTKLLELGKAHAPLAVTQWGYEELRQEAMALADNELASLLGPAPSRQGLLDLGLKDLAPVLDHIARFPAASDPDLRPVPADKLERNLLSDSVATLLKAGMGRVDVVRKYFKALPMSQDQIAESFKSKYRALREAGDSPDEVFAGLHRFASGPGLPSPARLSAVLAVLAFFFEECDIFEGADGSSDSS